MTICLNMIVKNERPVIERCLKSVLPIIDSWVIVDTGSEDGTQECIKKVLKEIPGELHQRPWKNFGFNRQEALDLARRRADYILFMDADDILSFNEGFVLPALTYDFYAIATVANEIETVLPRLVKSSVEWQWQGVLHEYIRAEHDTEGVLLDRVKYIYKSDGARSKNPKRALEDIEILKEGLESEPENPRYVFYLGITYYSIQDYANALKYFELRAKYLDSFSEERFISKLNIAKIRQTLNEDPKLVESSFIEACKVDPFRKEPFYYLVHLWRKRGDFQKAFEVASRALTLPKKRCLYGEKWIEDYGLLFEYAWCSFHRHHYQESLWACLDMLKFPELELGFRKEVEALQDRIKNSSESDIPRHLRELLRS